MIENKDTNNWSQYARWGDKH